MEPSSWVSLPIVLGLTLVNVLIVASETALLSVRRGRIGELAEAGDGRARRVQRLNDMPLRLRGRLRAVTTILAFTAGTVAAVNLGPELGRAIPNEPLAVALVVLATLTVTLVATEIAARRRAEDPEGLALSSAASMESLLQLVAPLAWLVARPAALLSRVRGAAPVGPPTNGSEDLRWLIQEGEKRGAIEDEEAAMIHGVMDLASRPVRAVMTARPDVIMVESGTKAGEALDVALKHGFSRLPVYKDTVDTIVGVVSVREIAAALRTAGNGDTPVDELAWDSLFVPETKLTGDLLAELQDLKTHLAIVVDEYGDTAGIVTLEDIIEEIVGEIADETDVEQPGLVRLDADTAVVDGRMAIADLNDELDLDIEADGADTVGGLVFLSLGHVPDEGEKLDVDGVSIEVLRVDNTRIRLVRLTEPDVVEEEE